MSLKKIETYNEELSEKNEKINHAATPKQSKDLDMNSFTKKSISLDEDLFSDFLSNYPKNDEVGINKIEFNSKLAIESNSKNSELNDIFDTREKVLSPKFKAFDHTKKLFGNDPNSGQRIILHNINVFVQRKKAKLKSKKKNPIIKNRKGSRVVSEGTENKNIRTQKEVEQDLENDIFPSDRFNLNFEINKDKKEKFNGFKVGSANFISTSFHHNKNVDIKNEELTIINEKSLRFKSPPNLKFKTPVNENKFKKQNPPKLVRPTWQKEAKFSSPDSDSIFRPMNDKICLLNFYQPLKKENLLQIKESNKENEIGEVRNEFENFMLFGVNSPEINLGSDDRQTLANSEEVLNSNFQLQFESIESLFNSDPINTDNKEIYQFDNKEDDLKSILNPNVITFEKNIFNNIFGEKNQNVNNENISDCFISDYFASKKSKSSSCENLF